MKHVSAITQTPAKAFLEHPTWYDSLFGFWRDPADVITSHLGLKKVAPVSEVAVS